MFWEIVFIEHSSSPSLKILFSVVSVTYVQPRSKNIIGKIPQINNSLRFKLCTIMSSVTKSHALLALTWIISPLVAMSVIRSTVKVLQCLCSSKAYII